ncbi:peptidase S51 [Bifidobacterium aemilianum]|uniref:Peptidase S51 n=2 Tax=Bifidobacterium aemilianum TaxID=2493120 RepID=A0A366K963_9BIFI|nr:peptidase S51 [Bifidobacterium aemilianum]
MLLVSQFLSVSDLLVDLEPQLRGKSVLYIPTASNPQVHQQAVRVAARRLRRMGLRVRTVDVAKVSPRLVHRALTHCDIIYIGGGNTFYLLQELRRIGADRMLVDQVRRGKIYVGESAGAVITAPDIAYIGEMDDAGRAPELSDTQGLGLVDFSVVPHYGTPWANPATAAIIRKYLQILKLRIIRDDQAILVRGDHAEVICEH